MPTYLDLLNSSNFIGGAGKEGLFNPLSDSRITVPKVSGFYQFNWYALTSLSDLNTLGYYDTPSTDTDSNLGTNDREYAYLPTGSAPSLNANQLSILYSVVAGGGYNSFFSDVANIQFSHGTVYTSDIVIGATTNGGTPSVGSGTGGYELDDSDNWGALSMGTYG